MAKIKKVIKNIKHRVKRGRIHSICQNCYKLKVLEGGMREPIEVPFPLCAQERCCFCGNGTHLGIYYREKGRPDYCQCSTAKRKQRHRMAANTAKGYYVRDRGSFITIGNHAILKYDADIAKDLPKKGGDVTIRVEAVE